MANLDKVRHEIVRAQGVIAALYAICRDDVLCVEKEKTCKLDDVISDVINGLNGAVMEVMMAQEAEHGKTD